MAKNQEQHTKQEATVYHGAIRPALLFALFSFTIVSFAHAGDMTSSKVISLTNVSRADAGLPALTENEKLTRAAKAKAEDMIKNDYFAHTSPKGVAPWHWIKQTGYEYKFAGENLAINFDSAKEQHQAWMKSATHKANILNTHYQEIGIAVAEGKIDGKNVIVTVQFFGTPLMPIVAKKPATAETPAALPAKTPVAVQGVETEMSAPAAPQKAEPVMVSDTNFSAAPANQSANATQASLGRLDMAWIGFILLLELLLIVAPVAFLWKTGEQLARIASAASRIQAPIKHFFPGEGLHSHTLHAKGGHI